MDTVSSFKTSATIHPSTGLHIPEEN